jgi:HD-GYP domain-containing protein (c-di-GMP phosphodiesterase class II)
MPETMQKLLHTFAALADLGQEIADTDDYHEMARASLHLLLGTLAIRRGALAMHNPERAALSFVAARGFGDETPPDLPINEEDIEDILSIGLCGQACEAETQSFLRFVKRHQEMIVRLRVELIVPLVVSGNLLGVILLGDKASGETFTSDDRDVVCAMARHIGVGLHRHRLLAELEHKVEENRHLYVGLREVYKDTVRAFAAAIDRKDKYTQGHSERVGKYSEIIAREMGWSEDEIEAISIAGYLHDIGKLVVERDILNAPYRIDAKKSKELNHHPVAGYEILTPISYPNTDISLIARYHHERVDGRGYPDGLHSEDIPVGAKIVALADSFDAMTTDRPYKRRRAFEEVIEDLRRTTGKQFAPDVVLSFCRALLKEANGETRDRRIIKMLGKDYLDSEQIIPALSEFISDLESGSYEALAATAANAESVAASSEK